MNTYEKNKSQILIGAVFDFCFYANLLNYFHFMALTGVNLLTIKEGMINTIKVINSVCPLINAILPQSNDTGA
jgi:hypothetical protein